MPTPRIHSRPVPSAEPPYDDELTSGGAAGSALDAPVQGALALRFDLPTGVPAGPPARDLRLLPGGSDASPVPDEFDPIPTSTAHLPPAAAWARRIVQAVLEVVAGERPVAQLLRWLDEEVYHDVQRRVVVLARVRSAARHGDAEAASRARRPGVAGGRVLRVRVCEPRDGVAEACATVRRDGRVLAVAIRLEGLDGRWRCTALELG